MSSRKGGKDPGKTGRKKGTKKSSLPAFGFSEDLLRGKKDEPREDDTPASAAAEKPAPQPAAPQPAAPQPAAPQPAAPQPAEASAPPPEEPRKKITLPAYGFAKDLLKELKSQDSALGGSKGGRDSAPDPEPAPAAPQPDADGPDADENRVFSFADSLDTSYEEQQAAPVVFETWVTFTLKGEMFALPVDPVHEVLRLSSITRVPHAPYPIRGVTNLRGRVVPVIDLRLRLDLPEGEVTRSSRIVVVGSRGRRLGLLVDAVHQVVHLEVDRIQPPPDDVMTIQSDYIAGVYHMGEELILLLDVDRVLIIKDPIPTGAGPAASGAPASGAPASGAA